MRARTAWGCTGLPGDLPMKTIIAAAALISAATGAQALALYDNDAPVASAGGNCIFQCFGRIGAENFTLANLSTVEALTFRALHSRTLSLEGAVVSWGVWSSAGAQPGVSLASGSMSLASDFVVAYVYGTYDVRRVVVDIPDMQLAAGSYWASFNVSIPGDPFAFFWQLSTDGDALSAVSADGGATWSAPYGGFTSGAVFSVEGFEGVATAATDAAPAVPLPAALPLLGAGVAGLGLMRARRA